MVTCGTDIIKISRVKDSIERIGETFLKRVYTDEEIEYCESRRMCKYQSYAARFAAKEAIYKAISPNKGNEASWKDAEVCKYENGNLLYVDDVNTLESKLFSEISHYC